jgi:hypothetical protein
LKVIWIGALLSLLVVVFYDRINQGTGAQRPIQSAVTLPLSTNNGADIAISPAEYVLLHQTRYESMPLSTGGLRAPASN